MSGKLLMIYICNFHVLSDLLLIYICKLHWNSNTLDIDIIELWIRRDQDLGKRNQWKFFIFSYVNNYRNILSFFLVLYSHYVNPEFVKLFGISIDRYYQSGKFLLIYICNFHVLSDLLLIYICKLHWYFNWWILPIRCC